jgi:hypothetical protein
MVVAVKEAGKERVEVGGVVAETVAEMEEAAMEVEGVAAVKVVGTGVVGWAEAAMVEATEAVEMAAGVKEEAKAGGVMEVGTEVVGGR